MTVPLRQTLGIGAALTALATSITIFVFVTGRASLCDVWSGFCVLSSLTQASRSAETAVAPLSQRAEMAGVSTPDPAGDAYRELEGQLAVPWNRGEWSTVAQLLEQFLIKYSGHLGARQKFHDALVSHGRALAAAGLIEQARERCERARGIQAIDTGGAVTCVEGLAPTATPLPPTVVPTAIPTVRPLNTRPPAPSGSAATVIRQPTAAPQPAPIPPSISAATVRPSSVVSPQGNGPSGAGLLRVYQVDPSDPSRLRDIRDDAFDVAVQVTKVGTSLVYGCNFGIDWKILAAGDYAIDLRIPPVARTRLGRPLGGTLPGQGSVHILDGMLTVVRLELGSGFLEVDPPVPASGKGDGCAVRPPVAERWVELEYLDPFRTEVNPETWLGQAGLRWTELTLVGDPLLERAPSGRLVGAGVVVDTRGLSVSWPGVVTTDSESRISRMPSSFQFQPDAGGTSVVYSNVVANGVVTVWLDGRNWPQLVDLASRIDR